MTDVAGTTAKLPVLQKPPGFRDPQHSFPASSRPPPRKPPLPQTFRQAGKPARNRHHTKSICCRRFCCFILIFIFSLLFLLALTGTVCYLYFQPHIPSFRLQTVQTPRFNATTKSDGSGTFLDATVRVKIFASNQNGKISLSYGGSNAAVYISDNDGDVSVGSGSMPGFIQGERNATVLKFSAEVKGLLLDDAVGTRLRSRFRSREIRFGVGVRLGIGMGVGGKMTGRMPIRVDCPPVSLKQVKGGGILPKCDIYWFGWINL